MGGRLRRATSAFRPWRMVTGGAAFRRDGFFFLSFSLMHKQFQHLEWGGRRMGLEMTNLLNERWALDVETHVSILISESTRPVLTNLLLLLFL